MYTIQTLGKLLIKDGLALFFPKADASYKLTSIIPRRVNCLLRLRKRDSAELIGGMRREIGQIKLKQTLQPCPTAKCSFRTSLAVKIETNITGAAAFSTLGRPFASLRSTRHITPTSSKPNWRAASMA
jgi:hypothetical protein